MQRDIHYLNFPALKDVGDRGAIFDKDNCLVSTSQYSNSPSHSYQSRLTASDTAATPFQTLPHDDELVPEIEVRPPAFKQSFICCHHIARITRYLTLLRSHHL